MVVGGVGVLVVGGVMTRFGVPTSSSDIDGDMGISLPGRDPSDGTVG